MEKSRELYLIDGSSYLYRSYYGIKSPLTSPQGVPTGAVYNFAQMLQKVLKEREPAYMCVLFDAPGRKFRHDLYEAYKKRREVMPEELIVQSQYIKKLIDLLGVPRWEEERYEADDLIASIVSWARDKGGFRIVIVSGDKDLHQLVESPYVVQWDTQRDILYDEGAIVKKFGVPPSKMRDFLALVGDKSDDIPGVPGIGEKGAAKLLARFPSLDDILERIERGDDLGEPLSAGKIRDNKEKCLLSRTLVGLRSDFSSKVDISMLVVKKAQVSALAEFYKELGFNSFLKGLEKQHPPAGQDSPAERNTGGRLSINRKVTVIQSKAELLELMETIKSVGSCSLDLETTSEHPLEADIVGCAISVKPFEAFYVPFSWGGESWLKDFLELFKPLLEDAKILKYGQNQKYEVVVFKCYGLEMKGLAFDTMVASYLLEPGQPSHGLKRIAEKYLKEPMRTYKDVTTIEREDEKGKVKAKQVRFQEVPLEEAAQYAGADAEVVQRLLPVLKKELAREDLIELYNSMELPLIEVLASMEYHGVLVDVDKLRLLSKEFEVRLKQQESKIFSLAGGPFNIQSPKQLSYILFEKMNLPSIKKTKTGLSTDMMVLEELAVSYPIAQEILAYRSLAKLKNTYVDKLPELVNPRTGRIHTSYNQTVTSTGRLSSSNPNLQNIPIRTEEGRRIREAFVPKGVNKLLSADYSQIELRLLAHYSEDDNLMRAFEEGDDIHRRTASQIFEVPFQEVTPDMRRQAKTINFGIIYGMGPYKLSKTLGISQHEAKEAINRYFEQYRGVKAFTERIIEQALKNGYVSTLLGRKRWIPEIQSHNKNIRQQGERLALNTVIQGSAADIIKKAMINIHRRLISEGLRAFLILQVHDELVLEVPEEELERVRCIVKECMERVCDLRVPLYVEMGTGSNWSEAHT